MFFNGLKATTVKGHLTSCKGVVTHKVRIIALKKKSEHFQDAKINSIQQFPTDSDYSLICHMYSISGSRAELRQWKKGGLNGQNELAFYTKG